jgi:hypothetical protein
MRWRVVWVLMGEGGEGDSKNPARFPWRGTRGGSRLWGIVKHVGVTQRVFRDPTPQFPIRHKDRRRVDDRPQREPSVHFLYKEVPEGRGQLSMNTVSMPVLGSSSDLAMGRPSPVFGKVLGVISLILLGQLWMIVTMSFLCGALGWDWTFWHDHLGWSFPVALLGVHLFGMFSSNASEGDFTLGQISIGLFWLGLLIWIPVQIALQFFLR